MIDDGMNAFVFAGARGGEQKLISSVRFRRCCGVVATFGKYSWREFPLGLSILNKELPLKFYRPESRSLVRFVPSCYRQVNLSSAHNTASFPLASRLSPLARFFRCLLGVGRCPLVMWMMDGMNASGFCGGPRLKTKLISFGVLRRCRDFWQTFQVTVSFGTV